MACGSSSRRRMAPRRVYINNLHRLHNESAKDAVYKYARLENYDEKKRLYYIAKRAVDKERKSWSYLDKNNPTWELLDRVAEEAVEKAMKKKVNTS